MDIPITTILPWVLLIPASLLAALVTCTLFDGIVSEQTQGRIFYSAWFCWAVVGALIILTHRGVVTWS